MSDVSEDYKALREHNKRKREGNLSNAIANDDGGWTKHTTYHWSRTLNGKRLDYWPSRNKFQYEGKISYGGIDGFIRKREAH